MITQSSKVNSFFLLIDVYSKWPEIFPVNKVTSSETIDILRRLFAAYGLPKLLVSDNAAGFTSSEFSSFLQRNGVQHVKTAPYHPSSNSAVERLVQTFKSAMSKNSDLPLRHRVLNFLFSVRNTPHCSTNYDPSKLFFGRPVRTKLSLALPDPKRFMCISQERQKFNFDRHHSAKPVQFEAGDTVLVSDPIGSNKCKFGKVVNRVGNVNYSINMDGRIVIKHVDQFIKFHKKSFETEKTVSQKSEPTDRAMNGDTGDFVPVVQSIPSPAEQPIETSKFDHNVVTNETSIAVDDRRYPVRSRKPPERLNL